MKTINGVSMDQIISKPALSEIVGLSVSQLTRLEKEDRFPKRIHIGKRRVGWSLKEVVAWIEEKKESRNILNN